MPHRTDLPHLSYENRRKIRYVNHYVAFISHDLKQNKRQQNDTFKKWMKAREEKYLQKCDAEKFVRIKEKEPPLSASNVGLHLEKILSCNIGYMRKIVCIMCYVHKIRG